MAESKHTRGPWRLVQDMPNAVFASDESGSKVAAIHGRHAFPEYLSADERRANLNLIAAAPDHALICWAMCVGAGRWEPWGDGRGEFCINGMRHSTELDEFGCPRVTPALRSAIARAEGRDHA